MCRTYVSVWLFLFRSIGIGFTLGVTLAFSHNFLAVMRRAMVGSLVWVSLASSDLPTANWALFSNAGDLPSARFHHAMAALVDGTLVVFGGLDNDFALVCGTCKLEVSGSAATWTLLSNTGDSPSSVYDHAMGVLSDGSVVVYGGDTVDGISDETYQLEVSGSTATWTLLSNTGDSPGGRYDHAMAALSDGSVATGNVDETHQLVVSGSTAAWKLLSTQGDTPGARVYHTMAAR